MCGLSTVVTPAGASLTMYREIRSYANSIWDDNNNRRRRIECGNYRGLSLVAHAGKISLKIVPNRLGDFCEETGVRPEEQCGFRSQCSAIDIMFVVRRLQELGRASNTSLEIFSLIWQKHTTLPFVYY